MATRAEWQERVDRWRQSGLGATAFGVLEDVEPKQLSQWKWYLKRTTAKEKPSRRSSKQEMAAFLPVRMRGASGLDRPVKVEGSPVVEVEVQISGGPTVRLRSAAGPEWLAKFARELGRGGDEC